MIQFPINTDSTVLLCSSQKPIGFGGWDLRKAIERQTNRNCSPPWLTSIWYIDNFPLSIQRVADIPDDFQPPPLGTRRDLIARIREVAPDAEFSDPARGVLLTRDYSIEFSMGASDTCKSITLEIRGGGNPAAFVAALLSHMNLRAIDCQTGEFFDTGAAQASFDDWQRYRDQILGQPSGDHEEKKEES